MLYDIDLVNDMECVIFQNEFSLCVLLNPTRFPPLFDVETMLLLSSVGSGLKILQKEKLSLIILGTAGTW